MACAQFLEVEFGFQQAEHLIVHAGVTVQPEQVVPGRLVGGQHEGEVQAPVRKVIFCAFSQAGGHLSAVRELLQQSRMTLRPGGLNGDGTNLGQGGLGQMCPGRHLVQHRRGVQGEAAQMQRADQRPERGALQ